MLSQNVNIGKKQSLLFGTKKFWKLYDDLNFTYGKGELEELDENDLKEQEDEF